ncbi:MAG TPA: SUF system NifU family Fe-S cluster assembly protein [Thermoanaerobaculia bacterium]|nr:SUF system NifU family Fe-S cluster assembly protein [Thermoanaerobaculia bacterium]
MDMLRELYQQTILDHNRNPQHFRKLDDANRTAEGYNPLCGDHYTIYLKVNDDVVEAVGFQGSGCAISKASASVMSTLVKGKRASEIEAIFEQFTGMVKGELSQQESERLGKLAVFAGVREFPTRTKCATLAWHAVVSALAGEQESVKTE